MPSKLVGRLWVGGTTFLIAFISYSSQIFVIWPWYGRELSIELLNLLIPFNILVAMLYWNYYLCIVTNPGRVPIDWRPNFEVEHEVKKGSGGPRFCRTCNKYKPPRAHHCRQCRQCTLRMDHHCPWVNNCVGHYNYGHFIRFLFFVDIACLYHLAMVTARIRGAIVNGYWVDPTTSELVFIVLNYVACVPVIVMVGLFSLYHYYCLSLNTTTIEGWEKNKVATLIRRGKIEEIKFPYTLGLFANLRAVLGDNPLLWCWPNTIKGDGLRFPVSGGGKWVSFFHESNADHDTTAAHSWPPEDPYAHEHEESISLSQRLNSSSPFTYGDGQFNPELTPSNRASRLKRRGIGARVPPYHPSYRQVVEEEENESEHSDLGSESDCEVDPEVGPRVRRGSEGFEVKQIDREEILRRYIATRGEDALRTRDD